MQLEAIPKPSEQKIPNALNLFKIAVLITMILLIYAASSFGADWIEKTASGVMAPWQVFVAKWSWVALMGTLVSVPIIGLGVLAHDGVHKVLFSSLFWNEVLGGIISAITTIPFQSNRQFHLTHHSYAHQPGKDPENPMHNHSFYIAVAAGAAIAVGLQYKIWFTNLFTRMNDRRFVYRVVMDALGMGVTVGFHLVLVPWLGMKVQYTFLAFLAMLPAVFGWRAMADHYGLPALKRELPKGASADQAGFDEWHKDNPPIQQVVTGWVVLTHPILEWIWSNVNYHEVHHKFPYLSYIYLKQVFDLTKDKLPYAVANGYTRCLLANRKRKYYETSMP